MKLIPAVAAICAIALPVSGQSTAKSVAAHRTSEQMTVDGHLTESAWSEAAPATGFIQREPDELAAATERTVFRVVYSENTIYIGVYCLDGSPAAFVSKEMERDAPLYRDDSVAVVLDTFADRRNAYTFETNVNGARFDALITDEGRNVLKEWDGVWNVAARRAPDGWVAEFAIPFSTLRYDPNIETWGLNVRRMIRHKNEEVNWTVLGRDLGSYRDSEKYALYRISLAGELTGLHDIKPSRQIDIKPFLVTDIRQSPGSGRPQTDDELDLGLDVKWGLTRNLVADLTYNTDFAEVEVDDQQVNLTRFSLFFPEKREFFLENAGIFDFGPPQRDSVLPPLMKVFFSRRVGLEGGLEVPIDYGARLTGRIGGWNVGVMNVTTEMTSVGEGQGVADATHSVVRLKRNIGRRSGIGMIYTDREDDGLGSNRVVGVDFDYKPSTAVDVTGFWSQTDDDRRQGDD